MPRCCGRRRPEARAAAEPLLAACDDGKDPLARACGRLRRWALPLVLAALAAVGLLCAAWCPPQAASELVAQGVPPPAAHATGLESCDQSTGGSCFFSGCSSSRGPTVCSGHRCLCKEGYCASGGRCYEASVSADFRSCDAGPVGSCLIAGCITGRNSDCVHGRCMCREHFCAKRVGRLAGGVCEMPAQTWKAEVAEVDDRYPRFPPPHNGVGLALCLSGGGARAAAMTVGVLRALEDLGLMEHVDAISSVSGSLFSSIPYMFHDKTIIVDGEEVPLWGEGKAPEDLTLRELDYHTSPLSTQFADGWGGTWGTVTKGVPALLACIAESRHHQSPCWRRVMRSQFLGGLGLGDKDCFMAGSDEDEAKIKERNPLLKAFCFQKPKQGRPRVFVIGAALLAPAGEKKWDAVSYQISPDFSGAPFHVRMERGGRYSPESGMEINSSVVGGGLIQTFAVDSDAPHRDQMGGMCVGTGDLCLREVRSPAKPFTLAEAMAMATYADFLSALPAGDWTPISSYWPIGEGSEPARKFMIGDAGFIEDTGVLPMLQRRAGQIVAMLFVGPGQELDTAVDWCGLSQDASFDTTSFVAGGKICDSLYTMFGYGYDDGQWHKSHNTVFRQREMFEVACELKKLKEAGKPLVYRRRHQVVDNPYWGIRPYSVEVLYVYNDRVPEFEARLPEDTQHSLQTDMKGFPTDLPAGLYMKPRIIKLMAAQFEYNIKQNADTFKTFFRGM